MKSFNQFYEQAAAAAPAPTPVAPKTAAKPQAKAKPKVTDPSSGVDKDDRGRWQGQVVDQGKELEPEKTEVTPGRKGPDPSLPSGTAKGNIARAEYPHDEWNDEDEMLLKWLRQGGLPGADTEKDIERLLQRKRKYGASKGGETQIAAGGNPRNAGGTSSGDPNNIQWPRNKYPNKKAPPGPGYRPPTA